MSYEDQQSVPSCVAVLGFWVICINHKSRKQRPKPLQSRPALWKYPCVLLPIPLVSWSFTAHMKRASRYTQDNISYEEVHTGIVTPWWVHAWDNQGNQGLACTQEILADCLNQIQSSKLLGKQRFFWWELT